MDQSLFTRLVKDCLPAAAAVVHAVTTLNLDYSIMASQGGQKYSDTYSEKWPCISKSSMGSAYARCDTCECDFSISHSGAYDIQRHVQRSKHKSKVQCLEGVSKIDTFVHIPSSTSDVISSECTFANFLVEHNIPVNVSDHFTELIKVICPDSKIAKSWQCKRTKTSHIMHEMSREVIKSMEKTLKTEPFSISTDGSESRHKQLYPILVTYPDSDLEKIVTKLLKLCECKEACTGENIFKMLDSCVTKYSEPDWKQCIALSVDNESTMTGLFKGLAGHVLRKQNKIFIAGCTCHLIHLAAGKAAAKLPIKIEDLLIDVYFYLEKSHKRNILFEELQNECGTEVQSILKHCAVRWLSLEKCIIRLIAQWEPLTIFFTKEVKNQKPKDKKRSAAAFDDSANGDKKRSAAAFDDSANGLKSKTKMVKTSQTMTGVSASSSSKKTSKSKTTVPTSQNTSSSSMSNSISLSETLKTANIDRVHRVFYLLTDYRTKLYCLFLVSSTPLFNALNQLLQRNDPCIHILHECILTLLTDIYVRLVLPDAVKNVPYLKDVKYRDRANQKERDDLIIGSKTRSYLNQCKADESISKNDRNEFFESVREYFCTAADYVIKKFPINKDFLLHAEVADIKRKTTASFDSVKFFVNHLPCLRDLRDNHNIDNLEMEFGRYQIKELPPELCRVTIRIDTIWFKLKKDFPNLARVMLAILVIPHSNSEAERVFSIVRKNDTAFRPNLGVDLLESLLITKIDNLAKGTPCYKKKFTPSFLSRAKSCTYNALKKDKEKNTTDTPDDDITGDILKMITK